VPTPGVDADSALIDHADAAVAVMIDLVQSVRTDRRFPHERVGGGRDPYRGQVEEACLAEIEAGPDDAAGDAFSLGVRGA
jgi:hypothetical protein